MPMALQTQRNEGVKIFKANTRCMVSNATTSRETQQTIRHADVSTLKKLGFEGDKGQLREWMTVARDRSAWVLKVECKLDLPLPPGSFTNLRRHYYYQYR
jgi:hypothetical protein